MIYRLSSGYAIINLNRLYMSSLGRSFRYGAGEKPQPKRAAAVGKKEKSPNSQIQSQEVELDIWVNRELS